MTTNAAALLAVVLHDAGRQPVAAGQTLAHAVDPAMRFFIEWPDLPEHVRQGRLLTAERLLEVVEIAGIEHVAEDGRPVPQEAVDWLAEAIHNAERAAIEAGLVLVKLNRPWVAFAELPEQAQEGRRGQARYILGRLHVRRVESERAAVRPGFSWRFWRPAWRVPARGRGWRDC